MKTTVLTTIAQHPKGIDLHLRNLRWALKDLSPRIVVQTFKCYGLSIPDCEMIEADADPSKFHFFYDDLEFSDFNTDVLLTMEQDVLFTEPVAWQAARCREGRIVINLESPYLSILDGKRNIVYPRIWEGATWIPRQLIELSKGCSYGFKPKFIVPGKDSFQQNLHQLQNHYATCTRVENAKPVTEVLSRNRVDNMFELSVFCFLKNYPYECYGENDYHYGKSVVHVRGIESLCRDRPDIYRDISGLESLMNTVAYRLWCNDCGLMLLLCGAHDLETVRKWLLYRENRTTVSHKISRLLDTGNEWMTSEELKRLREAQRVLNVTLL